jgi:protein-L-isoaspartate O-methyltransferase
LQEAGKLKLTDTVRQWTPDVAFVNPWEAANPVRLVHLMEHTSGFDEMHLREYALNDPAMTLNDALAYGASSRVCRWPPGERMAYCNSGPAVLAAVIEKVSGERFEDYVQKHFFNPLHMDGASYFDTPEVERRLAKLYRPDGVTPYPYWHVGLRPTAGLNASARDMANYLRFYLQRGSLDGTQLLSAASIERMERGETLPAAKLGRMVEYGLFNYEFPYGPFVFHGHNGAVMGGITEMGYPRHLYQDVLIGLVPERFINNGLPSLHARCLAACNPQNGDTVLHIGAGTGYYSAILAELVGAGGKVIAYEIETELAERARRNLSHLPNVQVIGASGCAAALPPADLIYVSASAPQPMPVWLDALKLGGRLIFPLTPNKGVGCMLLVTRLAEARYAAAAVSGAAFIPLVGGGNDAMSEVLATALKKQSVAHVKSLRRNNQADASAWCAGDGWWLSTSEPAE